jgi:hypothetical protein
LAEQGIAVFLGPVGQLLDEVFDLLATGVSESLGATEVDGVGLHKSRVELVLADDLAETVTDLGPSAVAVGVLWRELLASVWDRPDFLD